MKFSIEERKTVVGQMMVDLRMDWSNTRNYQNRILTAIVQLGRLRHLDEENARQYEADLVICGTEFHRAGSENNNGSVFRDNASMYDYKSKEGCTKNVQRFLMDNCIMPEIHENLMK